MSGYEQLLGKRSMGKLAANLLLELKFVWEILSTSFTDVLYDELRELSQDLWAQNKGQLNSKLPLESLNAL